MRILIAEDDPVSRKMLSRALTRMGHDVISAENGRDAWQRLRADPVRLVIADWEMPEMDGVELVQRIRKDRDGNYTYLILLTSRSQRQDKVIGLEAGADDYITKPFDRDELMVRIRAGERIIALQEELAERNAQLAQMALIDGLTNVANRRAFDSEFHKLAAHSRRFSRPFSLLMLDIDYFKRYNDAYGHEAGDEALRRVAQALEETVRTSDSVFRYGGEEFVVLLPETGTSGAKLVAERLREAVEACAIPHPANEPVKVVTVSVGVATYMAQSGQLPDAALGQADEALYNAKRGGRNRVESTARSCPARG